MAIKRIKTDQEMIETNRQTKEEFFTPKLIGPDYTILDKKNEESLEYIGRILNPNATWKDAFMIPDKDMEYDKFDGSYNAAIVDKINKLFNTVSKEQRHKEGYYLANEVKDEPDKSKIRYISGDLELSKCEGTLRLDNLQHVAGSIILDTNESLIADKLQTVEEDIALYDNAKLHANSLHAVKGYVEVDPEATITADKLKIIGEFLSINGGVKKFDSIQTICGYLWIGQYSNFTANNLENIGTSITDITGIDDKPKHFSIYVGNSSFFEAQKLQTIYDITIDERGEFKADNLKTITDELEMKKETSIKLPNLQAVGRIKMEQGATLKAFKLYDFYNSESLIKKTKAQPKNQHHF